jgi:hypothetical protein
MSVTARKKKKPNSIVKEPTLVKPGAKLRQQPKYRSFRLHKRIKHPGKRLPNWWVLLKKSLNLMIVNKRQIAMFGLVYGLLNILLVRGFASSIDIVGLQESLGTIVGEESAGLVGGFTAFGLLLDASLQGSGEAAQIYQFLLLVIASLALIWMYRQQQAGNTVTMKMAFYRGMYPFIPFVLVMLVIGIQFIPALLGNFLLTTVISGGLAVGALEQIMWFLFFAMTLLLSLYMITSSSIALYIVTLPEMTPMIALRQARELVRYRRFSILIRSFAILLVILALLFVIVLPIIFIAPALAEWIFFAVTVLGIPLTHGYMFSLYRELL